MKTKNIIIAAILLGTTITQSCTKEYARIEGTGSIVTQTLNLRDFSGIAAAGADDVVISYGPEQKVEVTGHSNIISRIKTDVHSGIWEMELENGNYGRYELIYYITLPTIEKISYSGSANIRIDSPMDVDYLELSLMGSCSFNGFLLSANYCQVDISGSGEVEISAVKGLDVSIEGSGSVYYKGSPSIKDYISGSGSVIDSN